jgi:glycosyltransferase involved in cell wall biosynthesis
MASCIMPMRDRRLFVPQAVQYSLCQDYEPRELIIVDDGADVAADLIPEDSRIRYLRLPEQRPLGAKRNLACEAAMGMILLC